MEIILVIVLIVFVGVIWFGVKFVNFKSQLMNQLGKRGMDYEQADALYTIFHQRINTWHHDGISASAIADLLCLEIDETSQRAGKPSNLSYVSFDEWLNDFKLACEETRSGVTEFLPFMDLSNLEKAYLDNQNPEHLGRSFARDFDPTKIS